MRLDILLSVCMVYAVSCYNIPERDSKCKLKEYPMLLSYRINFIINEYMLFLIWIMWYGRSHRTYVYSADIKYLMFNKWNKYKWLHQITYIYLHWEWHRIKATWHTIKYGNRLYGYVLQICSKNEKIWKIQELLLRLPQCRNV